MRPSRAPAGIEGDVAGSWFERIDCASPRESEPPDEALEANAVGTLDDAARPAEPIALPGSPSCPFALATRSEVDLALDVCASLVPLYLSAGLESDI